MENMLTEGNHFGIDAFFLGRLSLDSQLMAERVIRIPSEQTLLVAL